jgi:hypothetical protein
MSFPHHDLDVARDRQAQLLRDAGVTDRSAAHVAEMRAREVEAQENKATPPTFSPASRLALTLAHHRRWGVV